MKNIFFVRCISFHDQWESGYMDFVPFFDLKKAKAYALACEGWQEIDLVLGAVEKEDGSIKPDFNKILWRKEEN